MEAAGRGRMVCEHSSAPFCGGGCMTAPLARMQAAMSIPDRKSQTEAEDNAQIAMRLLIRSGNLDRRLLEDRDWQQAMTFIHNVITKYQPK